MALPKASNPSLKTLIQLFRAGLARAPPGRCAEGLQHLLHGDVSDSHQAKSRHLVLLHLLNGKLIYDDEIPNLSEEAQPVDLSVVVAIPVRIALQCGCRSMCISSQKCE